MQPTDAQKSETDSSESQSDSRLRETTIPPELGWTDIPYKIYMKPNNSERKRYEQSLKKIDPPPNKTPGILYVNPTLYTEETASSGKFARTTPKPYSQKSNYTNRNNRPINHYWSGFTDTGCEKWVIEMENGNLISSKDSSYAWLVKTYFPSDMFFNQA